MNSAIYVIRSEPGPVKVGIATKLRLRLNGLRVSSAVPLHLDFAAETEGDVCALEKRAHAILASKRLRGKWFEVDAKDAVAAVLQAAEELGLVLKPARLAPSEDEKAAATESARIAAQKRAEATEALGLPTPRQFRAARGLLAWSRADVARATGLCDMTITRLEIETIGASQETQRRVQDVLESAGVEFLRTNGVRLKGRRRK